MGCRAPNNAFFFYILEARCPLRISCGKATEKFNPQP